MYRLWLHCCRKAEAVTLEQLIAFTPEKEDYLRRNHMFVDSEGKTTLNKEEYKAYRTSHAEALKQANKKKLAAKAAKTTF